MTVASLIGLEERERIADLYDRGRRLDDAYMMRSVMTKTGEGLKNKQHDWEQTLGRKPGALRGWAALSDDQRANIARILEYNRIEREAIERAKADAAKATKRPRRRKR
jgi:hypothetical protein